MLTLGGEGAGKMVWLTKGEVLNLGGVGCL